MNLDIYKNKKVFVTGHTGFKGSWLCLWLQELGAEVVGYSLPADELSHFNLLKLPMKSYFENINDQTMLTKAIKESKADIVFHLAAQALVRDSYDDPMTTYETNVLGSLKVYWASMQAGVQNLVSITTDKVYENREWQKGYKEEDTLGGYDPYSSSKACVELMTDSFRRSFLSDHKMRLATARAGNVIGGGDWAKDRLIPDLVRNASIGKVTPIRNPQSVRPWQHVLEPLHGYLMLGQKLLEGKTEFCTSFNFGPELEDVATVDKMCELAKNNWDKINAKFVEDTQKKHEAGLLKLDITKAKEVLNWKPMLDSLKATALTINWYKNYYQNQKISSGENLKDFMALS
ncbi:MAG: CDP-glucose 4,6-dehydratase [Bdellovibrio sp. CG12_big_fil_rev_8_21_14_0_65_39_13]|nr:MAG: CDP-glucose 4,6-dehydratase [Bdellovibrio sp. CG22_combo_CG10-13_8_21_14_all_39_27]PIQ60251.1 MAG: CDP-glucose 4,6-dehydratase [Bdellovibrio sp. CG12_big_fil_rev_8_21_14_0_65_39_13]PIR35180.1 MAG: CDP-glucose 4,6-dehydratase [Bdellovibrio sp. CG11_big_fil_rev_8_21_14_0_20_39_38]